MFLLDTNVVSELRKPRPHGAVLSWVDSVNPGDLRLPAVVVGELQAGIERLRPHDADKAEQFEAWLTKILETYAVIPMDGITFRLWAKLMAKRQEHLSEDAMIAATALQHNLTIVSRNKRHLDLFEVATFDPFTKR
jgi:predicted nucleic acid-binding protein